MLGFRPAYLPENAAALVSAAVVLAMTAAGAAWYYVLVMGNLAVLSPTILQLLAVRRGEKREPALPLTVILVSGLTAAVQPLVVPAAAVNAFLVEDVPSLLNVDVVSVARRSARIMVAPLRRSETAILVAVPVASAVIAFSATQSPLVFVYPVVSYLMVLYSVVYAPPGVRYESEPQGLLEVLARRLAIVYAFFARFYLSPSARRLGREAGLYGASYDSLVRKAGALHAVASYMALSAAPIFTAVLGPRGLAVPVLVYLATLLAPLLYLQLKRQGRASRLRKNLVLILTYLAAMKSVDETFASSMRFLRENPHLAELFGMKEEVDLFHQIRTAVGVDEAAVREYADTVPDDFFRDVIRSTQEIEENEGTQAAFRTLAAKLTEQTARYVAHAERIFETVGSNLVSVVILFQSALPLLLFLAAPTLVPFVLAASGLMGAGIMVFVLSMTVPNLPSDFIYAKPRWRRAALVFAVTAAVLSILEALLAPSLMPWVLLFNFPVAGAVAVYYAYRRDLAINWGLLDKLPDTSTLFSSALSRTNNVAHSLRELSEYTTFPSHIREEFARLARLFALLPPGQISYRGPYWYKFFLFMASIAAIYGVTPRELYKVVSAFALDFKKFVGSVRTFGATLSFLMILGLAIMSVQVTIGVAILEIFGASIEEVAGGAAGASGFNLPFPVLGERELAFVKLGSYAVMLLTAIVYGFILAKARSWSVRDGRYVLAMFVFQLLLIAAAEAGLITRLLGLEDLLVSEGS